MRMRLLVFGLIRLNLTVSASVVAGQSATGQVTRDRRRWPSHDGRAAMYFPLHWRGLNTAKSPSLQHYLTLQ